MEHDDGFLEVEDVLSLCWENGEVIAPLSITEKLLLTADAAMAPFSFNQHVDLTLQVSRATSEGVGQSQRRD